MKLDTNFEDSGIVYRPGVNFCTLCRSLVTRNKVLRIGVEVGAKNWKGWW